MKRHVGMYATDAQMAYLRRLQSACAPLRCAPYALDLRRAILRADASAHIERFKAALDSAKAVAS